MKLDSESLNGHYKYIRLDVQEKGAIWVATLDKPPMNTINRRCLDELISLVDQFNIEPKCRILILTGYGDKVFIGGVEIDEILAISSPEEGVMLATVGQNLCNKIEASTKLIIAAINGLCIGGGNEIAIACHLRVASEKAKFQQPEVSLGIIPAFGGTQRLSRTIGESRARKFILTGEVMLINSALQYGLVDEVAPYGEACNYAVRLAKNICQKSPVVVACAHRAISASRQDDSSFGMRKELEYFNEVCHSCDMKEGLMAFKERRRPIYQDTEVKKK